MDNDFLLAFYEEKRREITWTQDIENESKRVVEGKEESQGAAF